MLWGYIGPRYLGDFVPFLVLASAVGLADIFRRLDGRRRRVRVAAVAVIAALALFSIAANIGMAIVPNEEWNTTQLVNYVQAQKTVSDLTGHPLQARVVRGNALPPWGPAGELYVVGNCSGLYISNGENYSTVPSQQYQRTTWMPVELGQPFEHTFQMTVRSTESKGDGVDPTAQYGEVHGEGGCDTDIGGSRRHDVQNLRRREGGGRIFVRSQQRHDAHRDRDYRSRQPHCLKRRWTGSVARRRR